MRRTIIALVVGAALVVAPVAPAAKLKSGAYRGTTEQKGPANKVSFILDNKKVTNIKIDIHYLCDATPDSAKFMPFDAKVNKKGKFTATWVEFGFNALLTMSGKVKKNGKASGVASFTAALPEGTSCSSGKIGWKAHQKKQ